MIESAHAVLLGGRSIGTILQRGDVARFVFDEGYWASADRPVLGAWFEDNPRQSPQSAMRLPPWFSNLLPEGRLREWVARERGVSADRELQLLLQIGSDLPGAVEVVPNAGNREHLGSVSPVLASADDLRTPDTPWKFSLAGVGLKFSVLRDGGRLTIPGANVLGDWIVKLPDPAFPRLPFNEYGAMKLARRVGIQVPEIELVHRDTLSGIPTGLWPNDEHHAFAIQRFDRTTDGGRIHIEDFAQVRGWYSNDKYNGAFETVASLAYRRRDRRSLREFVRRLTYNLLVGNGDGHLKNWSFIYPDGKIAALSPAYDIVCTGAYYPPEEPDNIGLKFGGTKLFSRVTRNSFVRLQERLSAEQPDVLDVVDETITRFFREWSSGPPAELPDFVVGWITKHAESMRAQIGD